MRFAASVLTLSLVATSSVALTFVKRDAPTILTDITYIAGNISKLNADINTFAVSSTLVHGLALHTDSVKLDTAVKGATTDVLATPTLTEDEGNAILTAVQDLEDGIIGALTNITAVKANVQALPVGNLAALVLSDLKTLSADTQTFENDLIAISPADLLDTANQIADTVNAAFAAAIAAYS
ncbi:hypothetical protein BD410DRAFT_203717 [Rickenella mellea]|uniref:Hydrophobic surface binding protein n=1 Tax=Rickenella mellea TaxID=50990 RepID=A0A4Y7PHX3_9AGAM|nr:hypothetical protein BD410DRAFT_203717 [Rickenella mellea]